jgi:hypothetical protein
VAHICSRPITRSGVIFGQKKSFFGNNKCGRLRLGCLMPGWIKGLRGLRVNRKRKGLEKGLDSGLLLSTCPHARRTVDPRAESVCAHSKQKCRGPFGLCCCDSRSGSLAFTAFRVLSIYNARDSDIVPGSACFSKHFQRFIREHLDSLR